MLFVCGNCSHTAGSRLPPWPYVFVLMPAYVVGGWITPTRALIAVAARCLCLCYFVCGIAHYGRDGRDRRTGQRDRGNNSDGTEGTHGTEGTDGNIDEDSASS